eukprot:TRINITY_DN8909_c0_g1_i1.p1 TRINITY_DN8909_c0_g1~~TRINITY_DN8909_c0_g1_i1.p1  ORF type:complete len:1657 (+),score=398.59 TRINITY_DN8909_c0_g1_i1:54-4973(+)
MQTPSENPLHLPPLTRGLSRRTSGSTSSTLTPRKPKGGRVRAAPRRSGTDTPSSVESGARRSSRKRAADGSAETPTERVLPDVQKRVSQPPVPTKPAGPSRGGRPGLLQQERRVVERQRLKSSWLALRPHLEQICLSCLRKTGGKVHWGGWSPAAQPHPTHDDSSDEGSLHGRETSPPAAATAIQSWWRGCTTRATMRGLRSALPSSIWRLSAPATDFSTTRAAGDFLSDPHIVSVSGCNFFPTENQGGREMSLSAWADGLPAEWRASVPTARHVFHEEDILCARQRHLRRCSAALPHQCCFSRALSDVYRRILHSFRRAAPSIMWSRDAEDWKQARAEGAQDRRSQSPEPDEYTAQAAVSDEHRGRAVQAAAERRERQATIAEQETLLAARSWQAALLSMPPKDACEGIAAACLWTWIALDPATKQRRPLQIHATVTATAQRHPSAVVAVSQNELKEVLQVLEVFRPLIWRLDCFFSGMRWAQGVDWPRSAFFRASCRLSPELVAGSVIPISAFHSASVSRYETGSRDDVLSSGTTVRLLLSAPAVPLHFASLYQWNREVLLPPNRLFKVVGRVPATLTTMMGTLRDVIVLKELSDAPEDPGPAVDSAVGAARAAAPHFANFITRYIEPRLRTPAGNVVPLYKIVDEMRKQPTTMSVIIAPPGTGRSSLLLGTAARVYTGPRHTRAWMAHGAPLYLSLDQTPGVLSEMQLDALVLSTLGITTVGAAEEVRQRPFLLLLDGLDEIDFDSPQLRAMLAMLRRPAPAAAHEGSPTLPPLSKGRSVVAPQPTPTSPKETVRRITGRHLLAHAGVDSTRWPATHIVLVVAPQTLVSSGLTVEELCGPDCAVYRVLPLSSADVVRHAATRSGHAEDAASLGAALASVADDAFVCSLAISDSGAALWRVRAEQRLLGSTGKWEACEAAFRVHCAENMASVMATLGGVDCALPDGWSHRRVLWLVSLLSLAASLLTPGPAVIVAACGLVVGGGGTGGPLAVTAANEVIVAEEQIARMTVEQEEFMARHVMDAEQDLAEFVEPLELGEHHSRTAIEAQERTRIASLSFPWCVSKRLLPLRPDRKRQFRSAQLQAFLIARALLSLPADDRTASLGRLNPVVKAAALSTLNDRLSRDPGPFGDVWRGVALLSPEDIALASDAGPPGVAAMCGELGLIESPGAWEVREAALRRRAAFDLGAVGIVDLLPREWQSTSRVLCFLCRAAAAVFFLLPHTDASVHRLVAAECVNGDSELSPFADCHILDSLGAAEDGARQQIMVDQVVHRGRVWAAARPMPLPDAEHKVERIECAEAEGRVTISSEALHQARRICLPLTLLRAFPRTRKADTGVTDFLVARALIYLPPADRHCLLRHFQWQDCTKIVQLLEDRLTRSDAAARQERISVARKAALRAASRSQGAAAWAAGARDVTQLRLLATLGADINLAGDERGRTVLHREARAGRTAHLPLLQSLGADIAARDKSGATALHEAARWGHSEAVRTLRSLGSRLDVPDNLGQTALHHAARYNHHLTVKLLLRLGARTQATDNDGATPLHRAAVGGHERMLRVLAAAQESDPRRRDYAGRTAQLVALQMGHVAAASLLQAVEDAHLSGGQKAVVELLEALETQAMTGKERRRLPSLARRIPGPHAL